MAEKCHIKDTETGEVLVEDLSADEAHELASKTARETGHEIHVKDGDAVLYKCNKIDTVEGDDG